MIRIYIFLCFLIMSSGRAFAQGKFITVQLKNGTIVNGELLFANETGIMMCKEEGLSEDELSANDSLLFSLSYDQISEIKYEGNSNLVQKIVIGTVLGAAVGYVISIIIFPDKSDPNSVESDDPHIRNVLRTLTTGLFGVIGLVVSTLEGLFGTRDNCEITSIQNEQIKELKEMARYDRDIPGFLIMK